MRVPLLFTFVIRGISVGMSHLSVPVLTALHHEPKIIEKAFAAKSWNGAKFFSRRGLCNSSYQTVNLEMPVCNKQK